MSLQICIYCQRTGAETVFDREHIIPRNIGGGLFLDDFVCKECNSWLGAHVDPEVLRLPEILDAFAALSLPHNRDGIVSDYFNVLGELDGRVLKGCLANGGFSFHAQRLPDGSLVAPESAFEGILQTMASRTSLSPEQADAELRYLLSRYRKARRGTTVSSLALGLSLRKLAGNPTVDVVPKRRAKPERLVAKVAYEFLFLTLGRDLFLPENQGLVQALQNTIAQSDGPTVPVARLEPQSPAFSSLHTIHFFSSPAALFVHVLFFGRIYFLLLHGPLGGASLAQLQGQFGRDVAGIQFQQRLDCTAKAFWAIRNDGSGLRIV